MLNKGENALVSTVFLAIPGLRVMGVIGDIMSGVGMIVDSIKEDEETKSTRDKINGYFDDIDANIAKIKYFSF